MASTDEERIVRAAAAAVAELPDEAVKRVGDERTFTLLAAATTVAVRRRFSTAPDSSAIQEYVRSLKERFPDGADLIKPIVAEAVIRYAFGEEELLAGVGVEDLRTMLFLLPYAVVSEQNIDGENLDAFVDNVIEAANAG